MEVEIKKLYKDSKIPTKAHETDAGYDMYAHSRHIDGDGNVVYGTGVAIAIPKEHVGLIFPRSSISKYGLLLSNAVGVIDHGFSGEITMKFKHKNYAAKEYSIGDRIGQLIIMPYPSFDFKEVDELPDSERGTGGYGSTGN